MWSVQLPLLSVLWGGTLQAQTTAPEIEVRGNNVEIPSGPARSSKANHTEFGGVSYYQGLSMRQFTIRNIGTAALNLTGPSRVAITGASDFTVTAQPSAASIAGGGSLTFDVTFDPLNPGFKRAKVVIASNDSDEGSYQFDITGYGETFQDSWYGNGDWTIPAGLTSVTVETWGGGGPGANGGANAQTGGSGGGGGAAYARSTLTVVPGQVYSIVRGVRGDPTVGPANGGLSSFTRKSDNVMLLKAAGGNGASGSNGGSAGTAAQSIGDFVYSGAGGGGAGGRNGAGGGVSAGYVGTGGAGAGGGGAGGSNSGDSGGNPGGGGGGGAGGRRGGGPGGDGEVRISYSSYRPDIEVQGNGVAIADLDTQPAPEDHTAFGGTSVGGTITRTFTIRNTGSVDLNLTGSPVVTVSPATNFKVTTQATSPVAVNGSKTFVVSFMPTSAGLKQASVTIANDDADEYLYTFAIEGTGTAPDIAVETAAGAALLSSSGTVPFGIINTGTFSDFSVRIKNVGSAGLASIAASITGSNASEFSLVGTVPSSLAAGGDALFNVRFNPTTAGSKSATLQITSNDPDTPSYTVALTGTGFFGPEIAVLKGEAQTGTPLADNQGSQDLGTVYAGQTGTAQTFTIQNLGNDTLTGLNLQATGDSDFVNTLPSVATLAPGASTTFTITFAPASDGAKAATFRVISNDADENPFEIQVTGIGKPNSVPVITSNSGTAQVNWALSETNQFSMVITAEDADLPNQALSFSLSGPDAGLFSMVETTDGFRLIALRLFDFENPADAGGDNIYNVTVTVSDNGVPVLSDSQQFVISLINLNDPPVISAIPDQSLPVNGSTGPVPFTVTDIESAVRGRVLAPAGSARDVALGVATFGPTAFDIIADVVMAQPALADDPLTNAAQCAGKIVIVDRGIVGFSVKAINAQAAGAVGVIVVDNVTSSTPPSLGGTDPNVTIPVVSVTNAEGGALKSVLASGLTMNLARGLLSYPVSVTATSDNLALVSPGGIVLGVGATSSDYTINVTPEAGQSGIAVIMVSASDGIGSSNRRFLVIVKPADQVPATALIETFEGGAGFDQPGWLHATLNGSTAWQQTTARYRTESHSWHSPDAGVVSSRVLISPEIAVTAGSELSFYHTYAFEANVDIHADGGRLEYTVDGSTWQGVPDSAFVQGGFNGTVHPIAITNVLNGQGAWVGGSLGTMTEAVVDLGAFASGEVIRLRWHAAEDVSKTAGGWYVDDVTVRVPDMAITGLSAIPDGDITASSGEGTDFGAKPANAVNSPQIFTISNTGGADLTLAGVAPVTLSGDTGDFVITQPAASVIAAGASTTFTITFKPTSLGGKNAVVSVASDDADESPYTFAITGIAIDPKPEPVRSMAGQDVVTQGGAPGENGAAEVAKFDVLRRGGFLAENGHLVFPGFLEVGSGDPAVTVETRSGLWKTAGGNLFMMARTGTTVPDVPGAQFATLPEVPGISDEGETSLLATLVIGSGGVTASNDTGLWSELGGSGLRLLMREDDIVPGVTPTVKVGSFASGLYATATTGLDSGEAAFSVTYRGASTSSALLRASVSGDDIGISEIAREGNQAPGTAAGVVFTSLSGSYADPGRMDAQGNFVFSALTTPGNKEGIWYQPVTGGIPSKVIFSGEAAPGTTTTFSKLYRPSMGGNSYITFRAGVSATGDNATNTRNDGIWAGFANNPSSITCILRRGDGTSVVPNLPVGSLVGNVWGGWLTNSNRGAWKAWLDVDGNTTSAAPTDKHAIYSTLSGAMRLELKAGDAAPGTTGATFSTFDLPVVGGNNQYAFLGTLTGGDVVGTTNNEGIWKSTANGAALKLVLRKGDTMPTSKGPKIVQKIDLPGSGGTDRRWEQPVMDNAGRLVIYVTFGDGSSSQILVP